MERLREEPLNLSCTVYKQLILIGKLVHTHNCDNIHQLVIALKNSLHLSCNGIVLLAENLGIEDTARRLKRINRRIDTLR